MIVQPNLRAHFILA